MTSSLVCESTSCRVSSVLNRDGKQFGKKHLFDGNEETCWNSDQGAPQWVSVDFPQPVRVSELHVQFQGGFSGKQCLLQGFVKDDPSKTLMEFYPEDVNSTQVFQVPPSEPIHKLKLILCSSTDLFGRIVIYRLDVRGEKA
ncbi:nuclear receptor 2C2-associated protein [Lampetra fluviatilis]